MKDKYILISAGMLLIIAAIISWMALLTGVFSISINEIIYGLVWIVIGLVPIVMLLERKLIKRLEGKRIPAANMIMVLVILVLVGISELVNLLASPPSLSIGYFYDLIFSIGYLFLIAIFARYVFTHMHSSKEV